MCAGTQVCAALQSPAPHEHQKIHEVPVEADRTHTVRPDLRLTPRTIITEVNSPANLYSFRVTCTVLGGLQAPMPLLCAEALNRRATAKDLQIAGEKPPDPRALRRTPEVHQLSIATQLEPAVGRDGSFRFVQHCQRGVW